MMMRNSYGNTTRNRFPLGASCRPDGSCDFLVWAPRAAAVELLISDPPLPAVEMTPWGEGYYHTILPDIQPGSRYRYRLYPKENASRCESGFLERPDPASKNQPEGVHGPSQVTAGEFPWTDHAWAGLPLTRYIIYELHVGTFTNQGTFEAAIDYLDELVDLGITAVELMPAAQFPGTRNWGYDGVFPFAVQNSYGGPQGLKTFVNACHLKGLAVILDVVYNHLGPEGNYLRDFGPYFTDFYKTPWGEAVNFDGPESDHVRRFFMENARYWLKECRLDALRIDAVHAIFDFSAEPFLKELTRRAEQWEEDLNRRIYCIAESALNDPSIVSPRALGGFQMAAQWNDDFHHSLHALLTGESQGYYRDFGTLGNLECAMAEGFVNNGRYSPFYRRHYGTSSEHIPARRFVVFSQNHDQVGNRMHGDRLTRLVSFEQLKVAAAAVLLSPFIPLIFMGEEYGETAPFLYFTSHSDPKLVKAVQQGRREEFSAFKWEGTPPDPQAEATFNKSRLDRKRKQYPRNRTLLGFYRELIRLRKHWPALARLSKKNTLVQKDSDNGTLYWHRWYGTSEAFALFHFSGDTDGQKIPMPPGRWEKYLDSADTGWDGPGTVTPERMEADGNVKLSLREDSVVLFLRQAESY